MEETYIKPLSGEELLNTDSIKVRNFFDEIDSRRDVKDALKSELKSEDNDVVVFNSPVDMHVHFRTSTMMKLVAPFTAEQFSGAVIMPNIMDENGHPVLVTPDAILNYKEKIQEAVGSLFTPYMTAFFHPNGYTYDQLLSLRDDAGIIGIKYYPKGLTTNSDHGLSNPFSDEVVKTLKSMADLNMILMVHPESDGFVLNRESEFIIHVLSKWHYEIPDLRIVVEHVTTAKACQFVLDARPTVSATVTVHHLAMTLDDVIGGSMQPHNFCKPVAKTPEDRRWLQRVAFDGNPKFCLGTDSAPHPQSKKECCGCAAGCFTAPITLQFLTQLFFQNNVPFKNLEQFVSLNAKEIYGIDPPKRCIELERKPYKVPAAITSPFGDMTIVPWLAGQTLDWTLRHNK